MNKLAARVILYTNINVCMYTRIGLYFDLHFSCNCQFVSYSYGLEIVAIKFFFIIYI